MKKDGYNIKHWEIILDVIKGYDREFTVKDIYNRLDDKEGLTTIY